MHEKYGWLASCLLVAACSGGGKHEAKAPVAKAPPPPATDAWRKQSLSISVDGYMFGGAIQPAAAHWAGSGAWLAPNIAVTNAHVALRGLKITGKDDLGKEYVFDQILAVNEEADLAIIKTSAASESFLPMLAKPADPKSLRGTDVRVIGNTGDLGLSFYDGRITNVVGEANNPILLHDANTAGGSSGGPLIDKSGTLVGINHSSLPSLNAKAAAPAWIVHDTYEAASKKQPKPLAEAFDPNPEKLPVSWYVERAVCMKPGEIFKGVFAAVATNDLVASVQPAQATPMGFVLANGSEAMTESVITSGAIGVWTLHGGGQYTFGLLNPKDATAPACATVKFGRIDWAARFK